MNKNETIAKLEIMSSLVDNGITGETAIQLLKEIINEIEVT